MARILVVEDEEGLREYLAEALLTVGHAVTTAADGAVAMELLEKRAFDLVLTDLKMPRVDGMELVRRLRSEWPETEVVVLTAHGTVESAVEALKLGAFDYLRKPLESPGELRVLVDRALERRELVGTREGIRRAEGGEPPLAYRDPAMEPIVEGVSKVAPTEATVLLLGESGTGKEIVARTIHRRSRRRSGPFLAVNCAAISPTLLESELFGHERGAFTGATQTRRGRLELAAGGTFFLDEIGELGPDLQAKLLRVLQDQRFERVGGTRVFEADVRWIAATNRDLDRMLEEGSFREDLYHRLAVFPIRLPPLRDRRLDILPLAERLLAEVGAQLGRPGLTLAPAAASTLEEADWPGNIRELSNALERAAILSDGSTIDRHHLIFRSTGGRRRTAETRSLAELEREAIEATLEAVAGNRRKAAERLGIGLRTLYDKIKKYGLG